MVVLEDRLIFKSADSLAYPHFHVGNMRNKRNYYAVRHSAVKAQPNVKVLISMIRVDLLVV